MTVELDHPAAEIKRLQRCINDLVGLLGLSTSWIGRDPSHIARTLLDALEGMLALDLVFLRLIHPSTGAPIVMARVAPGRMLPEGAEALDEMLKECLDRDPQRWPPVLRKRLGGSELSILPLQVGLQSDLGLLIAGSERADFPSETERMLLTVAKNQAVIALQEARLLAEANQGLWKSEARETAILNSALDCIITIDHEGRITEFNPAAERTFGHRREDVLGAVLGDLIVPPALRERHRQGLARYVATGQGTVIGKRVEMTALRADGTEFPVELAITPIPGSGPPSFTGYLRDITERKQAEERLRKSERESRLIVDSIPGLIATFTPAGELEFVNRQIVEYFGRTLEELRRWGTDGTTHPEDNPRVVELFTRAMASGEPFELESRGSSSPGGRPIVRRGVRPGASHRRRLRV
jgi:PAS domain S-box-containing protein